MNRYSVEARNRLFLVVLNGLSTITIACLYKENLLFSLTYQSILKLKSQPAEILHFIFTNVTGTISIYISGAFFLSYQMLFIYLIYQIFIFLIENIRILNLYLKVFSVVQWLGQIARNNF